MKNNFTTKENEKYHSKPDEVDDYLYIGPYTCANTTASLDNVSIKHIINVTKEHPNYFPQFYDYMKIPVSDECKEDLAQYLDNAADYIEYAVKNRENILVHCAAGQSRSASIVLAYLVKHQQMTLKDALEFLKSKRNCVSPNIGFIRCLMDFEKKLTGDVTVDDKEILVDYIKNFFPQLSNNKILDELKKCNFDPEETATNLCDFCFD